jgi:hypothetical protein
MSPVSVSSPVAFPFSPSPLIIAAFYHATRSRSRESHKSHARSVTNPLALCLPVSTLCQGGVNSHLQRPILVGAFLKLRRVGQATTLPTEISAWHESVAVSGRTLTLYRLKPRSQSLCLTHRARQGRKKRGKMYVLLLAAGCLVQGGYWRLVRLIRSGRYSGWCKKWKARHE